MATLEEIRLPDIGDFDLVEVIEVLVSAGETVAVETSLITLESDKAAMEVPSPSAGIIKELKVSVGDKISQHALIALIEVSEQAAAETDKADESEPEKAEPTPVASASQPPTSSEAAIVRPPPVSDRRISFRPDAASHASPSVRRFARELGVDLRQVTGSGPKGRILRQDIKAFVKQAMTSGGAGGLSLPPAIEIDFARFGEIETQPLSRIQKLSAQHLHRSWLTVPHVTQFDEADITELEIWRQEHKAAAAKDGIKLTFLVFLLRACARALTEYPRFNGSLDESGENLIIKKYINIGVAVDTPNGLIVPVVKDVDKKSVNELAKELIDLSTRARNKRLKPEDIQGGTFTISSLGGIGGTGFTPIVNAPEVAILGVARTSVQPVWKEEAFVPRSILPFSLSYDHRAIDGANGVRFTTFLRSLLEDLNLLDLDK